MSNQPHPMISTQELALLINEPDVRLVDASWWLDGRDAYKDHRDMRIPGAVFFDIEDISDKRSALPHMLPEPETFARKVGDLGIAHDSRIIVYDTQGLFSAARAWWTFVVMGAKYVRVLDGGLPKWLAEGLPTENGPPRQPVKTTFKTRFEASQIASLDDVITALDSEVQLLDARAAARFSGKAAEPRPGMRGGHMPGALNLPFSALLHEDKTLKSASELGAIFRDAGLSMEHPVITTCGSGVTAAILTLALETLGKSTQLYDGSWSEWGSRKDTPILTNS